VDQATAVAERQATRGKLGGYPIVSWFGIAPHDGLHCAEGKSKCAPGGCRGNLAKKEVCRAALEINSSEFTPAIERLV
jgi:hypothetical protein